MEKLELFYDGECHLCYREVMHYKKKDKNNLLILTDISSPLFDARSYDLDPDQVQVHMHSKSESGEIFIGVDTFIEIWKRIPGFKGIKSFVSNKYFRPFMDTGYNVFAKNIRPNLPKRKCEDNKCKV